MSEYTTKQRTEALRILEEQSIWAACAATGAHHTTIYRWHAEHVRTLKETPEERAVRETEEADRLAITRLRLRRRLFEVSMGHVDRSDDTGKARDAKDWALAAAILIDKGRLELGEATGRVSVEGDSERRLSDAMDRLISEAEQMLADEAGS